MCGIFACLSTRTLSPAQVQSLLQCSHRMKHRGPDERDHQLIELSRARQLLLAHERLQIIDLKTGRQPIAGSKPGSWLVHNGEIYNHQAIRDSYANNAEHHLHTTCDSEVIVHLLEDLTTVDDGGLVCNRLDGVFAFVAVANGRVLIGRDPIGVKPLYYGRDDSGSYYFSSEMKSIVDMCPNEMKAFPPGHFWGFEADGTDTGLVQYYTPLWHQVDNCTAIGDKIKVRDGLIAATQKRLMTDVPLGVLLSGGLDSSLIASIAARIIKRQHTDIHIDRLHSFTIALNSDAPDAKAARQVAELIGSKHHEVHFTVQEGIDAIDNIVRHLETYDVTTVRAGIPMYLLCKYIHEMGIKVTLSGEGADEIFGGYLYFHNAPNDTEFVKETIRRVSLLSTSDCQRADKAPMAHAIEVRVPFLDRHFLDIAMSIRGADRRPANGIEKEIVRSGFDDPSDPWLPHNVLWRQKEQFSDGVGYNWIDGIKAYYAEQVSDAELASAAEDYPISPPTTKEAVYIRRLFVKHFGNGDQAAATVCRWSPKWQMNDDPSGRASSLHLASTEKSEKEMPVRSGKVA